MIYAIAIIAVQVITLIHIVRSGRTMPWLYVVIFLPLVGSIAYLVAEVLPEALGGQQAQHLGETLKDRADPERHLRALQDAAQQNDTPQARIKVAQELARLGRSADAAEAYRAAMTGLFADDEDLQFSLTTALFDAAEQGQGSWAAARAALTRLQEINPEFHRKEQILFQARLAEADGDVALAGRLYQELMVGFSSLEVRVRYAHFLFQNGRRDDARAMLLGVLDEAKRAAPHVRQMQAHWFQQAEAALAIVNRA